MLKIRLQQHERSKNKSEVSKMAPLAEDEIQKYCGKEGAQ